MDWKSQLEEQYIQVSKNGYNRFTVPTAPDFASVFSGFEIAENDSYQAVSQTFLPNLQTILIFSFGTTPTLVSSQRTAIRMGRSLVHGPIRQSFEYILPPRAELMIATLKEGAFFKIFGSAVSNVPGSIHPLGLLAGTCFTDLWFILKKMHSTAERLDYLVGLSSSVFPIKDAAIHDATHTPRQRPRYQRFIKAIELIKEIALTTGKTDWYTIVEQCGYENEDDLIEDFQHFIQISPRKYLLFQHDIC